MQQRRCLRAGEEINKINSPRFGLRTRLQHFWLPRWLNSALIILFCLFPHLPRIGIVTTQQEVQTPRDLYVNFAAFFGVVLNKTTPPASRRVRFHSPKVPLFITHPLIWPLTSALSANPPPSPGQWVSSSRLWWKSAAPPVSSRSWGGRKWV